MASWTAKGDTVYVSSDGDDIGSHVAAAVLSGDIAKAHKMSLLINIGGKTTESYAKKKWGAKVIIMGGDDLMIQAPASKFDPNDIEGMRADYKSKVGATLSCGIGSTPEEAMQAIVIAKNTGKNKAVYWEDSMKSTYKAVVKKRINELKTKLVAAGGPKLKESITEAAKVDIRAMHAKLKKHVSAQLKKELSKKLTIRAAPQKAGPTPEEKAKQEKAQKLKEKKAKAAKKHGPEMVAMIRNYLVHRDMEHRAHSRKAAAYSLMGDQKAAQAFRVAAKLVAKRTLADHKTLHAAAQAKDPEMLHRSIRAKVASLKGSMESRIRSARRAHRSAEVLATKLRNKIAAGKFKRSKALMPAIGRRAK